VLVRLGKVFVVFALVSTISAHWALLQTVAWTTMLANNLQSSSLPNAVAMTFDGQHPCPICHAIAAAKKSEQKNQMTNQNQKLDLILIDEKLVLIAPSQVELFPRTDHSAESLFPKPLTPPPRAFFV
jgi:hypothetical protein